MVEEHNRTFRQIAIDIEYGILVDAELNQIVARPMGRPIPYLYLSTDTFSDHFHGMYAPKGSNAYVVGEPKTFSKFSDTESSEPIEERLEIVAVQYYRIVE